MRRSGAIFRVWLVAGLLALAGCSSPDAKNKSGAAEKGSNPDASSKPVNLRVLCSFLPIWAFTQNVVGDRPGVEVAVLIPGHQGPHDYALTPGDLKTINAADLFVINGMDLEEFLVTAAKKARPDLKIVEAASAVAPIYASPDEPLERAHEAARLERDHEHRGVNPHAFASPRDAAKMVRTIGGALAEVDPLGAGIYRVNAAEYAERLEALADEFQQAAADAPNRRIATFHNAFDYLARDAGLEVAGVIETAPGQEPSAGELAGLAQKIKEQNVAAVFAEPQFSPRMAGVLAQEAGVRLETLDPAATGDMRPDYYEMVMRKNLKTLKRVLGAGRGAAP